MVFVPVVGRFKCESTLFQARGVEVERFVIHLGVHLVHDFLRFRSPGEGACPWYGVTASFFVDGEIVSHHCLAVILQPLTLEFLLSHVFVRLDRRAKTKRVIDVERELVFFGDLFGTFDAFRNFVVDPGLGLGGGFGVEFLGSAWWWSACLRVDYVMSARACFGPGMVACLVAKDALEHAVALARDAVSTRAFVIVFLHRVVAVAFGASHFPFWNWAFSGEVFHGVATRALDDDCFVPTMYKLDLAKPLPLVDYDYKRHSRHSSIRLLYPPPGGN